MRSLKVKAGSGGQELGEWITRSRSLGYAGPIGLEYKATADEAFDWLIRQPA